MLRLLSLGQDNPGTPLTIEETFARATEKRKRMVYLAIPITLGVGLLITTLYIGGRVIAARRHVSPVAARPVIVVPSPAKEVAASVPVQKKEPPVVAKVAAPQKLARHVGNAPLTLITPRAGETYLQLAAVTPHTVLRYLDELRESNLEPCVAPGPTPSLLRVLVGPFADAGSLSAAKARLDAAKLVWIIRHY